MTRALIATALLATAAPALAEPNYRLTPAQVQTQKIADHWEYAYIALSVLDTIDTRHCLHNDTCEEGNPLYGKHPSDARLIGVSLGTMALHYGIFRLIRGKDPKAAMRFAQIGVAVEGGYLLTTLKVPF